MLPHTSISTDAVSSAEHSMINIRDDPQEQEVCLSRDMTRSVVCVGNGGTRRDVR